MKQSSPENEVEREQVQVGGSRLNQKERKAFHAA